MIKQQQQPIIKQMSIMDTNNYDVIDESIENRRKFLTNIVSSTAAATFFSHVSPSYADEDGAVSVSTETAEITDKIYLEFQGLPSPTEGDMYATSNNRIVIGLFGKDAPEPVSILKQLVPTRQIGREGSGYMAPCKPREIRTLQREQLEANKVYNSCKESQDAGLGVSYELSTVWRVDKDNRIDLGAVAGKFVAREYPNFPDANPASTLRHTTPGTISVRRGNDGGFGFTISPGNNNKILDQDNIVVGRIIEGMDVVEQLNNLPVVQSSSVNYMSLTGGQKGKNAPDRSCRYGGSMYCNELKPLKKITVIRCGIV